MVRKLGESKEIFYYNVCGQVNTRKTLELAIQRSRELDIKKLIVASETGLSALEAAKMLRSTAIDLIVVTSAAGTKIEDTAIGDLRIGIPDQKIWKKLQRSEAKIVRATDPLYNIGAALEHKGTPTIGTFIRLCLKMISS